MRILSLNMWGRFGPYAERWAHAAEVLPKLGADVLAIQEAALDEPLDRVAEATGTRILVSDIGGTGLAVLSRLESLSNKLIEYRARSPLENYIRKFECVRLAHKKGEFLLINTHLSWKKGDDATRAGQAQELADFLAAKKLPAILCGDFNCEYGSGPMKPLRERYRDSLAGTVDEKRPTWDNANPFIRSHKEKFPDRRIDLILAGPEFLKLFPLNTARIVLNDSLPASAGVPFVSDHYGILAEFKDK